MPYKFWEDFLSFCFYSQIFCWKAILKKVGVESKLNFFVEARRSLWRSSKSNSFWYIFYFDFLEVYVSVLKRMIITIWRRSKWLPFALSFEIYKTISAILIIVIPVKTNLSNPIYTICIISTILVASMVISPFVVLDRMSTDWDWNVIIYIWFLKWGKLNLLSRFIFQECNCV